MSPAQNMSRNPILTPPWRKNKVAISAKDKWGRDTWGRLGRLAQSKTIVSQNLAPIQRIFDLTDAFVFPGGMPDTFWGSRIPESAQHDPLYSPPKSWGVLSSPHTCILELN
jgi:hypothetical protein